MPLPLPAVRCMGIAEVSRRHSEIDVYLLVCAGKLPHAARRLLSRTAWLG